MTLGFEPSSSDSPLRRIARAWLRARRWMREFLGSGEANRTVELRALARFHLWGRLPARLEPVALHAQAESHLVARSIFDGIAYDDLASIVEASGATVVDEAALREVRRGVDEELMLAMQELERIRDDLALRTSQAIGTCLRGASSDGPVEPSETDPG